MKKIFLESLLGKSLLRGFSFFFVVILLSGVFVISQLVNPQFKTQFVISARPVETDLPNIFLPRETYFPRPTLTPMPTASATPNVVETPIATAVPTVSPTSTPVISTPLPTVPPIVTKDCEVFYKSDSPWNKKITNPKYHSQSDQFIKRLKGDFGSDPNQYTYPVYKVNSTTPKVKVVFSGYYSAVENEVNHKRTKKAVVEISIPDNAKESHGTDGQIIIINEMTGEEWGLWRASKNSDGTWKAQNGYKYNIRWSAVPPTGFVSRGAGVPYSVGLIKKCEIEAGMINHAIAFAYDYPSNKFVFPATKSDGRGDSNLDIPEGARLQLNPNATEAEVKSWCTDSRGKINERSCRIVVKALQEYGMILIDGSGHPKIYAEDNITATWDNLWSKYIPSKIPYSAFKIIDF